MTSKSLFSRWLQGRRLRRERRNWVSSNVQAQVQRVSLDPGAAAKRQTENLYALGMDALRANQLDQAAGALAIAAARGHVRAQLHYGMLYEYGMGVAVDLASAEQWYLRAMAQGDPDAQFRLSVLRSTREGDSASATLTKRAA